MSAKIIFRRIGARIVPIRVDRVVKDAAYKTAKNLPAKDVTYKLFDVSNGVPRRIGEVWAQQWIKRPHRFTVGSAINKEFQKNGLGTEFYKKIGAIARKLGGKTLVGSTDNVAAVSKVRAKVGRTKSFVSPGSFSGTTHVTSLRKLAKKSK